MTIEKVPESKQAKPGSATTAPKVPITRRPGFYVFLLALMIAATGAWVYHLRARNFESTDDAFIDGHIVQISPRISDLVSAVHVDDNVFVHKGETLVELDPQDFRISLDHARAAEEAAR